MVIDVNHESLSSLASTVSSFRDNLERDTNRMDSSVIDSISSWSGEDKDAFLSKWNMINDSGSNYANMLTYLQYYADNLNSASVRYRNAQADAINKALFIVF